MNEFLKKQFMFVSKYQTNKWTSTHDDYPGAMFHFLHEKSIKN